MPHLNLKKLIHHLNCHNMNLHTLYMSCKDNALSDGILKEHLYISAIIQTLEGLQNSRH